MYRESKQRADSQCPRPAPDNQVLPITLPDNLNQPHPNDISSTVLRILGGKHGLLPSFVLPIKDSEIRFLIDEGSTTSYIRKHVAEKFSTAKEPVICSETGFGGTTKKYPTMQHLICMVKEHRIFEFEAIEKDSLAEGR